MNSPVYSYSLLCWDYEGSPDHRVAAPLGRGTKPLETYCYNYPSRRVGRGAQKSRQERQCGSAAVTNRGAIVRALFGMLSRALKRGALGPLEGSILTPSATAMWLINEVTATNPVLSVGPPVRKTDCRLFQLHCVQGAGPALELPTKAAPGCPAATARQRHISLMVRGF